MLQFPTEGTIQRIPAVHRHRGAEDSQARDNPVAESGKMYQADSLPVAGPPELLCEPSRQREAWQGEDRGDHHGQRGRTAVLSLPGVHPQPPQRVQRHIPGINVYLMYYCLNYNL
jgi:hypothetical protein